MVVNSRGLKFIQTTMFATRRRVPQQSTPSNLFHKIKMKFRKIRVSQVSCSLAQKNELHSETACLSGNSALFFFIRWVPYWTQVSVVVIEVKKSGLVHP